MNPYPLVREARARFRRLRARAGIDLLIVLGLAGVLFGLIDLAGQAAGPHRPLADIDLSLAELPRYAFYSLTRGPADRLEVAGVFRFSAWQRAKWVELPGAAIGLVWNSMMSMAGGWVFLTIIESFKLKNQDYRLPGIGSFLNEAWKQERYGAMAAG